MFIHLEKFLELTKNSYYYCYYYYYYYYHHHHEFLFLLHDRRVWIENINNVFLIKRKLKINILKTKKKHKRLCFKKLVSD